MIGLNVDDQISGAMQAERPGDSTRLAEEMLAFVVERTEDLLARYLPGARMPLLFAGLPCDATATADLLNLLGLLHELGIYVIGDADCEDLMVRLLGQVDPTSTTFASYRIAETLARFGAWEDNPLLEELDQESRDRVRAAIDSSAVYDEGGKPLGGRPRNYWAVLARCEHARELLGVLDDSTVYEACVARCQDLIEGAGKGFIDDSVDGCGRYDIYSPDMLLFLEPLWDRLDRQGLRRCLAAHRELLELAWDEDSGASHCWGRSAGLLAITMAIELAVTLVVEDEAPEPGREIGIASTAFTAQRRWWHEGLVAMHRHRAPYRYRGPQRLLQATCDHLTKLAESVLRLRRCDERISALPSATWRQEPVDRFLSFEEGGRCGLWIHHSPELSFQLPVVGGDRSDYLPWARKPGIFDVPSDANIACGLPVVRIDGRLWTVAGRPVEVSKTPGVLSLRYDRLRPLDALGAEGRPAEIQIVYRCEGGVLCAHHQWSAEGISGAQLCVPEADRPLRVSAEGHPAPVRIDVAGLAVWRGFHGQLQAVHDLPLEVGRKGLQVRLRVALA